MNKKLFIFYIVTLLSINFTFAQNDVYQNVGGNLDGSTSTTISNTSTGGLADTARYAALMVSAAIITLVIFKLIEGAVLKGTYDNIYDQQKGNKILKNATISFFIFIFVNLLFTYINPDYGSWIFNTSTGVTPNTTLSGGSCVVDQAYNNKSVEDQIKQDEESGKYKPWVYMDSTGHPTIGWGFNLAQSGASGFMQKAGIDNNTINSLLSASCKNVSTKDSARSPDSKCSTTITQAQADAMFNTLLAAQKDNIYRWVGGQDKYNALPINIQKALLNVMYNVGAGSMSEFVKMKAAVNAKDWKGVASELQNSDYCKTVGQRCSRLTGLILGECPTVMPSNSSSVAGQGNRCLKPVSQSNLVAVGDRAGGKCVPAGPIYLRADVAQKFKQMQQAAASANVKITPTTGYRNDNVQVCLWNQNGQDTSRVAKPCSVGGNGSNHVDGTAIDISMGCTTGDLPSKCNQKIYGWLKANASTYGFYNKLEKDPVHWSLSGD